MRNREMKQMMALASRLTLAQRRELMAALAASQASAESVVVIEGRVGAQPICAHCQGRHVVRNGQADGLQRYKCRNCGKTFNALTGTPLARLRHKGKWLTQAAVLQQGLIIVKAAEQLEVAPSTAFRWRHRFLALPQTVKARELTGIAEADETYMLHSCKGQAPRSLLKGHPISTAVPASAVTSASANPTAMRRLMVSGQRGIVEVGNVAPHQ